MKGAFHLVLVVLAGLGVACATTVDVAFDEREDFSRYRTWDWLPDGARRVDAPLGDPYALDGRLARLVERALHARGFERTGEAADVLVTAYLGVQRQLVYMNETHAIQQLSSLHSSPSYQVQVTERELQTYENGYLVIAIADGRQRRVIWRGELKGRFRDDFWPHLEEAVSSLLERFPPPAKPTEPPPAPRELP